MNAESELEAVGMAWGAAATGTPAATGSTGQGLSLMQESLAEITLARLPLVVLNMARAQGDYFQATRGGGHGDYRHLVLAPDGRGRGGRADGRWRSSWPTVAQPGAGVRRLLPGPHHPVGDDDPSRPAPAGHAGLGARRLHGWLGHAKLISSARLDASSETTSGYDLSVHYQRVRGGGTAEMLAGVEPLVDVGRHRGRRASWWSRSGTPGRYVRAAVRELRAAGRPVGYVRPITLCPFPSAAVAAAAEGRTRSSPSTRTTSGQMIDDVRLAVVGRRR